MIRSGSGKGNGRSGTASTTHVGVEPDDQDGAYAERLEPRLQGGAAERPEDVLLEEPLGSGPRLGSEAGRELRPPGARRERRPFMRPVVVEDPGDRPRLAPRLLDALADRGESGRVVGNGTVPCGESSFWASTTIRAFISGLLA
jgi:hypothetical protein